MTELDELQNQRPEIAIELLCRTLRAAAISRQWAFRLAALNAPQKIAHLLSEVRHRVEAGNRHAQALRTPFTQKDIADMCGISAIHANRAIADIRERGLGEFRRGTFYASSWESLQDYANFDPSYL